MQGMSVLRELFDENIVSTIHVMLDNPLQHFSLSQVAHFSGVSIPTTMRIINRLIDQGFLRVMMIGKTKYYQLMQNEKTDFLLNLVNGKEPKVSGL